MAVAIRELLLLVSCCILLKQVSISVFLSRTGHFSTEIKQHCSQAVPQRQLASHCLGVAVRQEAHAFPFAGGMLWSELPPPAPPSQCTIRSLVQETVAQAIAANTVATLAEGLVPESLEVECTQVFSHRAAPWAHSIKLNRISSCSGHCALAKLVNIKRVGRPWDDALLRKIGCRCPWALCENHWVLLERGTCRAALQPGRQRRGGELGWSKHEHTGGAH